MGKYRVEFDRENCIGAGACVATNADFWFIDQDGKATLKTAVFDDAKKLWILQIEDADFQKHMDAAGVCPVTVIHVYENDGDKKLI
jgi:ferredoxin